MTEMSTKALNINQHGVLHREYPGDCCLCKAEEKIKALELQLEEMRQVFKWADEELVRLKTGKESSLVEIVNAQDLKLKAMASVLRDVKGQFDERGDLLSGDADELYCKVKEVLGDL